MKPKFRVRPKVNAFVAAAFAVACCASGAVVTPRAGRAKSRPAASLQTATTKYALVIGNSNYKDMESERQPQTATRDAEAMGSALTTPLGFSVEVKSDMRTKAEMEAAIQTFGKKLGNDSIALFYYAGHGVQVDGNNYLIPVDAKFATADDVKRDALNLDTVFQVMRAAKTRLNVIILDACRSNSFPARPPTNSTDADSCALGLAPPSQRAPVEAIIAYATDPNAVASAASVDGHSQYTSGLLEYLRRPGLRIEEVFKLVNSYVSVLSQNRQRPWMVSSLSDNNKETYFSEPVYMIGQIMNGDDEVIVTVNNQQKMVWSINGSAEVPILLNPSDNSLSIQVYNARTFSDIFRLAPEGWSYSVCFTTKKKEPLQCFGASEDRPETGGRHHGKSFQVATATIHVDEKTGVISFPVVNKDVWR
jgi:hypothetical protein